MGAFRKKYESDVLGEARISVNSHLFFFSLLSLLASKYYQNIFNENQIATLFQFIFRFKLTTNLAMVHNTK